MRTTLVPAHGILTGRNGFEDFFNTLDDFFTSPARIRTAETFKIDLRENDTEYVIEAEMPGVKKEEISLNLDEGKLTLTVSRNESADDSAGSYIHRERRYSSMSRGVYLPEASAEDVKAKLTDGVLYVTVPKEKKANKQITVNIE